MTASDESNTVQESQSDGAAVSKVRGWGVLRQVIREVGIRGPGGAWRRGVEAVGFQFRTANNSKQVSVNTQKEGTTMKMQTKNTARVAKKHSRSKAIHLSLAAVASLIICCVACLGSGQSPTSGAGTATGASTKQADAPRATSKPVASQPEEAPRASTHLDKARKAVADGNLTMARHHAVKSWRGKPSVECMEVLVQILKYSAAAELDGMDGTDASSIAGYYAGVERETAELSQAVENQLQADLTDGHLTDKEATAYDGFRTSLKSFARSTAYKRLCAFTDYASIHIDKARELYKSGKEPWNDLEYMFCDALVELSKAWRVADELEGWKRDQMVRLHNDLKSELNDEEYRGAIGRAKLGQGPAYKSFE